MQRKIDSRVDLLDSLATWHARPVRGRQRARGHKVRRERERLEALQQPHDEEPCLIQREFLSQALDFGRQIHTHTHKSVAGGDGSRRAGRRRTAST